MFSGNVWTVLADTEYSPFLSPVSHIPGFMQPK